MSLKCINHSTQNENIFKILIFKKLYYALRPLNLPLVCCTGAIYATDYDVLFIN